MKSRAAEPLPIMDPRHPLQMELSAAQMAERKWRNIADSSHGDAKQRWAARNARFHAARVAELKHKLNAQQ